MNAALGHNVGANLASTSFASDAAVKTGISKRAVQRSEKMANTKEWYEFAGRLEKTAIRMFEELELPTNERKETYAVTLLARTISNFNGVMVLLNKDLVVEARTLMRCCWEDAFYLASIARHGEKFIGQVLKGDLIMRRARGERPRISPTAVRCLPAT
jgi:hypothetical protein